jgi:hypothetical protein
MEKKTYKILTNGTLEEFNSVFDRTPYLSKQKEKTIFKSPTIEYEGEFIFSDLYKAPLSEIQIFFNLIIKQSIKIVTNDTKENFLIVEKQQGALLSRIIKRYQYI